MKRLILSIFILLLTAFLIKPLFSAEEKYLLFICDWGSNGPGEEIEKVLSENQELKITVAWPETLKPSDTMLSLYKNKRIEPALALLSEPVFPMLYETVISSPVKVEFSWPNDSRDIIFNAQEEFNKNWSFTSKGFYLKSGILCEQLIKDLSSFGIKWMNINDIKGEKRGAYFSDDFLFLINRKEAFINSNDLVKWIDSRAEKIIVLVFDENNAISGPFLAELAQHIKQSENIEMVTPEDVNKKLEDLIPLEDSWQFDEDLTDFVRRPMLWYRLNTARELIENYKNSGQAKIDILDNVKSEIYHLYSYDLVLELQKPQINSRRELLFRAGISNVYRLLGEPIPEQMTSPLDELPALNSEESRFNVKLKENIISITNSNSSFKDNIRIWNFSGYKNKKSFAFNVSISSENPVSPYRVDIYMDLNNHHGAGLVKLLDGTDGFMDSVDAWEFALRMEGNKAYLYKSGSFKPRLVQEYDLKKPNSVEIPIKILRGNPLSWGYQVVISVQEPGGHAWKVHDIITPDDRTRRNVLKRIPIQIFAIRPKDKKSPGY